MAGKLADTRGRRGALLINVWAFLFGGLLQTFSIDMYSIIIARFLIGFASGTSSVLVPIYLGELAPPALRGFFGTLTQFALVTGILVSDLLSFILATSRLWRYLFSITSIGAVVQLLLAPFLLESPRWLLSRDPNSKRARVIIKKLRGMRYDYEVSTEAMHYIAACRAQDVRNPNANNCDGGGGGGGGAFTEMFRNQDVRLLLLCCLGLQMAQQLCGINAVFYYSTDFFEGIIDNPLVGTTLVGAINVIATYAAMLLMDSWGRRTLILISSGGMFLSCGIIVLALLGILNNLYALFAVNLYVTFFELGLGPIPFLLVAEMFDAKYVATAMSACIQLNWACNFIIGLVFPLMNQYLGPYSFAPFALILLITFVATYIYLPETRGTTPEELQEMIKEKNKETEFHNFNIIETPGTPMDIEWKAAMERIRFEEEEGMKLGSYSKFVLFYFFILGLLLKFEWVVVFQLTLCFCCCSSSSIIQIMVSLSLILIQRNNKR
jgi:SP family facilitated glucose transporter-like MFS transporter 3